MFQSLQTRFTRARRWLPVAVLSLVSLAAQAQAPANDDPSGAISLPVGTTCTPVNATNTGATTTATAALGYTNPGCGIAASPKDVWFKFITNATGQGSTAVTVTVAGTVAGQVRVFSAASATGPFTQVGCSAGTTNNTQAGPLDLRGLTPNTTYYVFVSGYGSGDTQGAFTICASQLTLANNDAAVAVLYTLGKVSSAYGSPVTVQAVVTNPGLNALANLPVTLTVSGATTYTNTQTVASLASGASTTLTYSYPVTGTSGSNTVTVSVPADDLATNNSQTTSQAVTANDMSYIVGTSFVGGAGVAAAGSIIVTRYTASGPAAVTSVTPTFFGAGTAGSTYQVVIFGATAGGQPGALLYTSPARPRPTLAAGATGADPVAIPSVSVGTSYFVGVKTVGADNISIAYQTEAPLRAGTFLYSTNGGTTFTDINTSTLNSRLAIDVTLGAPAACGIVTALAATNVTNTSATIGFTAPSGATSYTVTYTPAGGTATTVTPAPTASPVSLTGLTPNTTYTVNVTTNCAAGQSSGVVSVSFTTPAVAPANDDCANATPLTATATCTPVSATNTASTASPASVPAATCATAGPDVWFAITVPAGGGVTVTTSATTGTAPPLIDTVVQLYTGTCGSLTPVACNDDAIGAYSQVTATGLPVGTTVYARVFGYLGTTGAFSICASVPAAPLANDDPAGAISLPLAATCTPLNATNAGATTTTANGYANPGCGIAISPRDVWFKFTTAASGTGSTAVLVTVAGTVAGQVRVFSAASATGPFTQVGCSAGTTNNTQAGPLSLTGLTPNTTYYVFVSGYGSGDTQGAFTICATSQTSCAPITNLTATNVTATGATITFTAPSGTPTYVVTYTPAGGTATTVTPAPTGSPITLTGLTAGTVYTVSVTTSCGAGGAAVTTTTTFATPATAYCTSALAGICGGNNVTAVSITGTTLNATALTCTTVGANAYTAYPATPAANTALLNVGSPYTISVTVNAGSSVSVWVDYNHNFVFEPSEYVQLATNSTTATVTGTLSVPANAVLGQTGLRIRTRLNGNANGATDACTAFGSGETKDFTVTLRVGTGTRNEALAATVGLFPNPAHQSFQLAVPAGTLHAATATLRNTLGQVMQSRQLNLPAAGGTTDFNVSSLAPGVYTLTLKSGDDFVVKRVVVE